MLHETALQWLREFASQGILVTDAQLIIREWGRWLETHSERRATEMIGRNLFEVYPELIARGLTQYYEDALEGQVRVLAHRLHRYLLPLPPVAGDHSFAQMQQSVRIAPLVADGEVIGTITVIEDVTERVAREERLISLLEREQRAREEAEAANRAKDEFLATVSHELRTPLNAMSGWMQVLRRVEPDPESLVQGLEAMERNIKMQARLIEDILDVSRIITGKFSLEVRPVDLMTVIEAALDAVRPAAEAKEIQLCAALDPRTGPISGDPHRLQQIVWNLLANAIKFTPRAGRVEISLSRIDSHIEIKVTDTGQGIGAGFLPFVFDRFRQADSTSARQHGGLGLGLAIVRHLVEMHGGTAQAFSDGESKGATFVVQLPLMAVRKRRPQLTASTSPLAYEIPSPPSTSTQPDGGMNNVARLDGLRILIVDDEPDAREILSLMLTYCGAEVKTSASVQEVIDVMKQWQPDLLVSDVGMPNEDGYTLINRVRALAPEQGRNIPAVALTGYARPEDRARLLAAGYQLHFPKPVEIEDLAKGIAALAGRGDKAKQQPR